MTAPFANSSVSTPLSDFDSTLRLVDFADTAPTKLKQQINEAIDKASAYLDNLDKLELDKLETAGQDASIEATSALADITKFDHINLALDRSWGILSHLNSVISNDEIRTIHHELLPKLSAYGSRVGQNKPLFNCYQTIKNDFNDNLVLLFFVLVLITIPLSNFINSSLLVCFFISSLYFLKKHCV